MFVTLGIGSLLLGGWVLVTPPADDQTDATAPPAATAPQLPASGTTN